MHPWHTAGLEGAVDLARCAQPRIWLPVMLGADGRTAALNVILAVAVPRFPARPDTYGPRWAREIGPGGLAPPV